MDMKILDVKNADEFRKWLSENGTKEKECYILLKRGKPKDDAFFYYLDAVEAALCYGWIDGTVRFRDGISIQRFSPRAQGSPWTELNKERVRRLERLNLMRDEGRKVLPPMGPGSFHVHPEVKKALKEARLWTKFCSFPPLYQRVRAYNVAFYINKNKKAYEAALQSLIDNTRKGILYGNWDDYGRLSIGAKEKPED